MRTTNFIKKNKYIVLLIGASRYNTHKYADIPNVETNIKLMKELFLDPRYIGVSERNIIVSLNEDSKTIERKITDAKDMAKNSDYTLFVYYSGHGIINPDNYKLYFATSDMDVNYLDTDAIEAKAVLEKISRSAASRKIFVVDACHSGGIHNVMGDAPETALMKNFEGVHYVSACDEDSTALFPKKMPGAPTYFTGALISRIHNGMDTDRPYLTLREVVDDIAYDFKYNKNLPVPQQSSVLNADQMPFAVNVAVAANMSSALPAIETEAEKANESEVESAWQKALNANTIAAYYQFVERFAKSKYAKTAENKIVALEEDEKWAKTESICTLIAYESYKKAYPFGKYISQANAKIAEFKNRKNDDEMWNIAYSANTEAKYKEYISMYPNGAHIVEANNKLHEIAGSKIARIGFWAVFVVALTFFVFKSGNGNDHYNGTIVIPSDSIQAPAATPADTTKSFADKTKNIRVDENYDAYSLERQADILLKNDEMGDYNVCLQKYEMALTIQPDNERIRTKYNELKNKIDSLFDRYVYMASRYLDGGDFDPNDFKECINKAEALKSGDPKVYELNQKFNALFKSNVK